jgi:hypothetical protein
MKQLVLLVALVSLAVAQNKPGNEGGLPTGMANGSVWASNAVSQPGGHQIKPVIDVTDQGFIGNGVTDNTAAATTLLRTIGSNSATILFSAGTFLLGTISFPANVTLEFSASGAISIATGQTVTIQGPINTTPRQIFFNVASGQGATSFSGNHLLGRISPPWWGLDCTGTNDNAAVWTQILAFTGDNSTFIMPQNCVDKHASTVTVSSRAGFSLLSETRALNGGGNVQRPEELWTGSSGGMWNFVANQAPTIEGFLFTNNNGVSSFPLTYFLSFDGNPSTYIGTEAMARYNTFNNSMIAPTGYAAIIISPTTGQNQEKNVVTDNDFFCSQSKAFRENGHDAMQISSGSNILTCGGANCTFTTDGLTIGERVRVTYATGVLDTTISSITDNNHIVMLANAASNQSNARAFFGQAYGYGIAVHSVNAKHNTFDRNSFTQCEHGLHIGTGSFSAVHLGGSANDVLAYIQNISESSELAYLEDENSLRDLYTSNLDAPLVVSHARNSITNAESDGFLYFSSNARIEITGSTLQDTPIANSVVIGATSPYTVALTSIGNLYSPGATTMATLGYAAWRGIGSNQGFLISCGDFGTSDLPATCFQYSENGPLRLDGPATFNGINFGTDNANDIGATGTHRPRNVYAATQFISQVDTGTAPFSIASTTPVANLTVSNHPTLVDCGTTSTCSAARKTAALIVRGSVAFPTATTVTVTSLPFTSSSSYSCTAGDQTNPAGVINATIYTSGSSVTFTETNGGNTDTIRYICVGF